MTLPCPSIPDHRYWSGFDRWEHGSIGHRRIACQMSPYFDHAMDLNGLAWWWDSDHVVWWQVHHEAQGDILLDNALVVALASHAVPIIRTMSFSPTAAERDEAIAALTRIADVLSDRWRRDGDDAGWLWSASAVYRNTTKVLRWQIEDASPPKFLQRVFDDLEADPKRRARG